ncbi:MAG: aminotransferase class IV [Planctomycetota bacterium]|jgi:D-alanine transaminase
MELAMIADKIVPMAELDPAYLDRGMYFGDGVYEVVRSYDGKIFALEEHLQRFANSLAQTQTAGVDLETVRRRVEEAFAQAAIADAKIYFHITRGSAPRNHLCHENLKPNFFLTISHLPDDTEAKTKGIAVSTHPDWRWRRCDIKSLNLLPNVLARMDAAKKGCEEAIFVDEAGLITEGSASAFFAVIKDALQTAPLTANILPSITREFVIEAAGNISLPVIEQSLTPERAADADELFIAVTTRDTVPVVRFDDKPIANAKPGKCTKMLMDAFRNFTR